MGWFVGKDTQKLAQILDEDMVEMNKIGVERLAFIVESSGELLFAFLLAFFICWQVALVAVGIVGFCFFAVIVFSIKKEEVKEGEAEGFWDDVCGKKLEAVEILGN
eukprot:CAMPEP_0202980156 /NCGR_PEP_ID=MMETSP1396-20130829/86130_1 /ASSEMBLY_ACC=CAM_ASM_000872 /TAXON_ID= /ORGANISM="Pseudokeronopsis sp., Strain Brazil" /LENGTH=105 /DNA_ID=CAMNT_0049719947 /DNA_START=246 /DNA_END=563 /DNA_ORIENTATION=-